MTAAKPQPDITWNGSSGTIMSPPMETEPDEAIWRELIKDWGLNPAFLEIIDGSIELIGWDSPVKGTKTGETIRLKRYKARFRKTVAAGDRLDVDALCKQIARRKPMQRPAASSHERALVVGLADWQIGKGEGDGTAATVARIERAYDQLGEHIKTMRKIGRPITDVVMVGMGDICEACVGHYPGQTFTVDCTHREQKRIARQTILAGVDLVSPLVERVTLGAVPGNHGENRNGAGKAYTTIEDNDDLAVFEELGEALAMNPARYGHVEVMLADDADLILDVCGVEIAFRHGHLGASGSMQKIETWWREQALGRRPVANATILHTAHYHHFLCSEKTGRTVFQHPAMDPGSAWYERLKGATSPSGMLVHGAGTVYGPRGWGDLALLGS